MILAEPKFKDGWEAMRAQLEELAAAEAPDVRHRPNKHQTFDHEVYAARGADLDKFGCVQELAMAEAPKWWPKEKLVHVGKGKFAPRPTSNSDLREYRKRCAEVTGIRFEEV